LIIDIDLVLIYIFHLSKKKWFGEKVTFYVAYVKMKKNGTKISLVTFFAFLHRKMSVFYEIVRERINVKVYMQIFF
jgi:hypothetical protein